MKICGCSLMLEPPQQPPAFRVCFSSEAERSSRYGAFSELPA